MEKQGGKLKSHVVVLMIVVAIFFDVLQFVLGFIYLGWLVGIFAGLTFWMWFRMHGIKIGFGNPKRILSFAGTSIVEMVPIPLLASLPGWTLLVVFMAISNKVKEISPVFNAASKMIPTTSRLKG